MLLFDWLFDKNKNSIVYETSDKNAAIRNLNAYNTDSRNVFGALLNEFAFLIVENVIRIFSSTDNLLYRDIVLWNNTIQSKNCIVLGDDIFGGIFAICMNNEIFNQGNICYWTPDSMEWEDLEVSLKVFFDFLKGGDIYDFYSQYGTGLYEKCRGLSIGFNNVITFYPPQWSKEFYEAEPTIKVIDIKEYYKLNFCDISD